MARTAAVLLPVPDVPAVTPEVNQLSDSRLDRFFTSTERISIIDDVFTTYNELISLKEKDISELVGAFGCFTIPNGTIIFGVRCTKKIRWLVHWAQDRRWTKFTITFVATNNRRREG